MLSDDAIFLIFPVVKGDERLFLSGSKCVFFLGISYEGRIFFLPFNGDALDLEAVLLRLLSCISYVSFEFITSLDE